MAVLRIVRYGEDILRQPTKEVSKISSKIKKLATDMIETMYANNGVGLAATQVGENYRMFVIDVAEENEPANPLVFVNPKIVKKSDPINSYEGCLSFPGAYTNVRRYANIVVKAKDLKGKPFVLEATGGSLLAMAIQHETDHLNGILFVDHARNRFETNNELIKHNLPSIDDEKLLNEDEMENIIQIAEAKAAEKEKQKKLQEEQNAQTVTIENQE